MRCSVALTALAAMASSALGRVYFEETFSSPESVERFKASKALENVGAIKYSPGEWYADKDASAGLQIAEDARFYAYTAKLKRPFNSKGKDFVVQFTVKYEQDIDCGGAYLKLLPPSLDPKKFEGESEYEVMFGPDICGSTNRRVHAIINYNNTNNQIDKVIQPRGDQLTHQYTFWVKSDKTFEIRIDNKVQEEGKIEEFWKVLPEKQIPDPDAKKPEDWVDGPIMIDDSEDKKPKDWIDGPATIPDPDAKKPEDWDDDMDGDWEPPTIPNPEYKGEWKPRKIKNPEYKGEWEAPLIDNPDYEEDEDLAVFNIGYIGIDVWTVKSGTIFDNILITDDIDYASEFGNKTWADYVEAEIAAKKVVDDAEAKKVEEELKAKEKAAEEAKAKEEEENDEDAEEKDGKDADDDKDELDEGDDDDVDADEGKKDVEADEDEDKKDAEADEDEDKKDAEADEDEDKKDAEDEADEDEGEDKKDEDKEDDKDEEAEEEAEEAKETAEKEADSKTTKTDKKAAKREAAKKAKKAAEEAKKMAEEAAKKAEAAAAAAAEDDSDDKDAGHDEL